MTPTVKKSILYLAAIALVVVVGLAGRSYLMGDGPAPVSAGKVAIGGPFTLVDHNGRTVTDQDFRGKHMLVYFGYTYCPDVCPTSLTVMQDALEILGDAADLVTPVFVSVDPARDTPDHLKEYVTFFHPRMVGLSGTEDQVAAAAKAYRVYYKKVVEDGGDPADYLMDHTSITYLMGPDGAYVAHFSHGVTAEDMAARLAGLLE